MELTRKTRKVSTTMQSLKDLFALEGVEEQSKWKARRVLQFIDDESAEGKIEKRRNEFKAEAPDAFTWPNGSCS